MPSIPPSQAFLVLDAPGNPYMKLMLEMRFEHAVKIQHVWHTFILGVADYSPIKTTADWREWVLAHAPDAIWRTRINSRSTRIWVLIPDQNHAFEYRMRWT